MELKEGVENAGVRGGEEAYFNPSSLLGGDQGGVGLFMRGAPLCARSGQGRFPNLPGIFLISNFLLIFYYAQSTQKQKFMSDALNLLMDFAESKRANSRALLNVETQSELGQYFTNRIIAEYMASMFDFKGENISVLDPGAGVGVLSAAFVRRAIGMKNKPKSITVLACEIDSSLHSSLNETLQECEQHCRNQGVTFTYTIETRDFVEFAAEFLQFGLFNGDRKDLAFNYVIMNPPYKKLGNDSKQYNILKSIGVNVPNIYAAFVMLGSRLLVKEGQLTAITPRSFCNGTYFRRFRIDWFNIGSLNHIHVFPSRNRAFAEDQVLQENVIFRYTRTDDDKKTITISEGDLTDGVFSQSIKVPKEKIISYKDSDKVVSIPTSLINNSFIRFQPLLCYKLSMLGLGVSTGKIVDFRSSSQLRQSPSNSTVPLIYPQHFEGLGINWPQEQSKKPNAIEQNETTKPFLLQSGNYVIVKRFSSKEERKRIYAAVIEPKMIGNQPFAIENHVNYYHYNGRGLDLYLARGLAVFLNTSRADEEFRVFSGHTQVNASDLTRLSYPSKEKLRAIGRGIKKMELSQHEIDKIVEEELDNEGK